MPSPAARRRPRRLFWAMMAAIFAADCVLRFLYLYLDDVTRGRPGTAVTRALEETTGSAWAFALFAGVVALERRFPLDAARWRELAAAALRQALTQAQLETLQLRLQPHFLFNALNTISSTMYEAPARADAMVGHLGDLLRQ